MLATMTPPTIRAPYNIRVNPTGGARTRAAHPYRVSAPPAGYPDRWAAARDRDAR